MQHVHADLVRASGFEFAADLGDVPALVAIARLDGVVGDRLATVLANSLLEAVVLIAV
jgi:hypothetical protein